MSYNLKEKFVERAYQNLMTINHHFQQNSTIVGSKEEEFSNFFEVTNLIIYCYGLIVFPFEKYFNDDKLELKFLKSDASAYGEFRLCTKKHTSDEQSTDMYTFLYRMRNAIAHGHITVEKSDENFQIVSLYLTDGENEERNNKFKAIVSLEQIESLCETIKDVVITNKLNS